MLNKFIDLERLTTFFQGLKDIFLQKNEASTTYATKTEVNDFKNSKGQAGGIAGLDNTGKVPSSQLPPVELVDTAPNLTLNELTLGGRFKIAYNDIEDSLDIEVI